MSIFLLLGLGLGKSIRIVAIEERAHDAYIKVCGEVPGGTSQLLL